MFDEFALFVAERRNVLVYGTARLLAMIIMLLTLDNGPALDGHLEHRDGRALRPLPFAGVSGVFGVSGVDGREVAASVGYATRPTVTSKGTRSTRSYSPSPMASTTSRPISRQRRRRSS